MKLTREQFIAQFPIEANVDRIRDTLTETPSPVQFDGVKVYRALNLIIISVDGVFYGRG